MNRRTVIGGIGGAVAVAGTAAYWLSDRANLSRADIKPVRDDTTTLTPDEQQILYLASLAPSGHNTQPWFVESVAPYHLVIGNDKRKWLPAVDPNQRETVLSLGAFLQNVEYAAGALGYACRWNRLATTNQDARVMEVKLVKTSAAMPFDTEKIESRRTVRSHFSSNALTTKDTAYLVNGEPEFIHYLPTGSKESAYIDEQTIVANRLQSYRDPAQRELANWIRFSSKNAARHRDGLTTASMEIEGIAGFMVRNFYGERDVMKADFRERGIEQVVKQVSESAGWIVITSRDSSVAALLNTGRRMERLFLKVRERGIALHPMTQILEESATRETVNASLGIRENIQFLLRVGYVGAYPPPVSLRRPVSWFVRHGDAVDKTILMRRGNN